MIYCKMKGKLLLCESLPFTMLKLTFCGSKAYLLLYRGIVAAMPVGL